MIRHYRMITPKSLKECMSQWQSRLLVLFHMPNWKDPSFMTGHLKVVVRVN